jgi:hypothetical protein
VHAAEACTRRSGQAETVRDLGAGCCCVGWMPPTYRPHHIERSKSRRRTHAEPPFWTRSPPAGLFRVAAQNWAFSVPSAVGQHGVPGGDVGDQMEGAADGGEGDTGMRPGGVLVMQHRGRAADSAQRLLGEGPRLPLVCPGGGWRLLVDSARLGLPVAGGSARLFERGRAPATPMVGGAGRVPAGNRCLRLVFASEPVERLAGLRHRFAAAF